MKTHRRILVGTAAGLFEFGAEARAPLEALAGVEITALARQGPTTWVLADGRSLRRLHDDGRLEEIARIEGPAGTCLAPAPGGLLVGTEEARLVRLEDGALRRLEAFERVEGRSRWFTPWGDPPETRSISVGPDGAVYVNVHVGGVVRSRDGARWTPTVDIEADVHQVLAHPGRPGLVAAAAAVGLGLSRDGGDTWRFDTAGLHARYLRAVAFAGDIVLVSASTGPSGRRAAVYRKALEGEAAFERCGQGLPEWFTGNVDTACLAAAGTAVVLGTRDGRVYGSEDAGWTWTDVAKGLPEVRCVAVV